MVTQLLNKYIKQKDKKDKLDKFIKTYLFKLCKKGNSKNRIKY